MRRALDVAAVVATAVATVVALGAAGALGGCTRPCKPDTLLVTLALDGTAATADKLVVELTAGKKTLTASGAHTPGAARGTLEVDFAGGYVKGTLLDVTVLATKGGITVGAGRSSGVVLAAGCSNLSLEVSASGPPDLGPLPPPDMSGYAPPVTVSQNATSKIDILFMVDNSPSMDAMQTQLKAQFASFMTPFVELATLGYYPDLHIGVVTSDYGAGAVTDLAAGCDKSPGGQRGLLQSTAAANTPAAGCAGPVGSPFITYQFAPGGDHSNLPGATSPTALTNTFTCMASVGSGGCGFEHQLESVYAALHNQFENAGFLRDDAILAVVFFTNEDDASSPPTVDFFNPEPAKATPQMYGALDTYRQTRFGVGCGNPLMLTPYADSMGLLAGCMGAPNPTQGPTLEFDVSRYTQLFTQPKSAGGIKSDPSNVVLVAIDAPETSVQIIQVAANTGNGKGAYPNPAAYQPCPAPSVVDGKNCFVRLDHSCQNHSAPAFFGDPAVRLNQVVRAGQYAQVFSICGDNPNAAPDYSKALTSTGNLLRARMLGNCVTTPLGDPGNPECSVVAHSTDGDGGALSTSLPRCDRGAPPCWTVTAQASCNSISPDGVAITLTTSGPPPAGTTITASCKGP